MIIVIYTNQFAQKSTLICVLTRSEADVEPERGLLPEKYGLALVNKGSHRLLMVRRPRGADHVFRFLVQRIQKVGCQGMVKVVLHAGVSLQGAFGQRPCKRKCNIAKLGVGYHSID